MSEYIGSGGTVGTSTSRSEGFLIPFEISCDTGFLASPSRCDPNHPSCRATECPFIWGHFLSQAGIPRSVISPPCHFERSEKSFPPVQAERKISPHYVRRNDKLCVQVEFAQVLHCIAVRKLSPLPLNPVIPARHALRLTLSFPPSCHFERSEKSSSRYTLTLSSPPIMSFRAQREIFPFSLFLPLSPLNAWDPARAAHAGPIHVCSQCHAPVPVSRGGARGNSGAPAQGGPRFQACRRPRGSGSIPPPGPGGGG